MKICTETCSVVCFDSVVHYNPVSNLGLVASLASPFKIQMTTKLPSLLLPSSKPPHPMRRHVLFAFSPI